MTLDYRKFKKINLKLDCFFLPFFLQAEARVLRQQYVIAIFLNESLTIAYSQYYNGISVGQLKLLCSILLEFISFDPYFCLIWSSKYNFQGLLPPKYQTCSFSILLSYLYNLTLLRDMGQHKFLIMQFLCFPLALCCFILNIFLSALF